MTIWLYTQELSCSNSVSSNKVEKGLVKGVSEGIGVILSVWAGGVAGSEMILGTIGRVNFTKKLWEKFVSLIRNFQFLDYLVP